MCSSCVCACACARVCVFCMNICLHTYSYSAYPGQKGASDPPELKLKVVVSYHVNAGN